MDNAYRVVLEVDIPYYVYLKDGSRQVVRTSHETVLFDYVEDCSTSMTSDITTHPLVNGDIIADHMYRNPISMTINGNFSLQGNKLWEVSGDSSDRLSNIEAFFERIKNEGLFCKIVKMSMTDKSKVRFIARENMVLTGIRWTERQNSLGFGFDFNEAIVANVQDIDDADKELDDNLPALTDGAVLDFTDTLLDMTQVDEIVVCILYNAGLVSSDFLSAALQNAILIKDSIVAGVAAAGGTALVGALALVAVFGTSIPVAGWVVAGLAAIAAGIAAAITSYIEAKQKKEAEARYKLQAFQLYQDDRRNQAEFTRFYNYVGSIHQQLETLEDYTLVYGIPANENQECLINVGGDNYVFKFTRNNVDKKWYLTVDSLTDDKPVVEDQLLNGFNDLSELSTNNALFRMDGNGYFVYLMNFKVGQAIADGKSEEEIQALTDDLSNYCIFITGLYMDAFLNLLWGIIDNAMTR